MAEYSPILILGAVMGFFSICAIVAYAIFKKHKPKDLDRQMSDLELLRRLLYYAKDYWYMFPIALIVMLISVAHDVLSPLLVGRIQELLSGKFELSQLYSIIIVYVSVLAVSMLCTYLQALILQSVGQKILSNLRQAVYDHVQGLSHNQLNHIPAGVLVTRIVHDPGGVSNLFTNVLVTLVKNVMVIVAVLVAMLMLNYALTLVMLCFMPYAMLLAFVFRKFFRNAHRKVTDANTEINAFLSENLSGMKITQIFNQEDRKMDEFLQRSDALKKARHGRIYIMSFFRPLLQMLYQSSLLCLFFVAGKGYIQETALLGQTITASIVVSFYMYNSKFFNPLFAIVDQFDALQQAYASAEKIFRVLDTKPELVDAEDAIDVPEIRGEIEFKDVWFAYEPDVWVLKGVSFKVEPGKTVAFVGATGSGKTTILSLLCRNYDIQKGQILVDGIDIRKIKISCLRSFFGQMLQDVLLFSGTVRDNIALGLEVSDEAVWDAMHLVNADSFVKALPEGLDYEVRERGNNFSAGQRQLLSFARTVLHKPAVMIMDEATANIDTETEVLIQDSLEKMRNIGTVLVVAHRLSTIQNADDIILLSQGEILEQGNHQQLLALHGRYHKLYTLQQQKELLQKT